jgi:hypothetical protein
MAPPSATQEATSYAAAETAYQTLFGTAELVEQILLHLPAKHIVSSQRVCKTFAIAVNTSPSMQEKMFKRLSKRPDEQPPEPTRRPAEGQQPTLLEAFHEAELTASLQSRTVLSPWLAVVPEMRKCWKGRRRPKGVKVQFKWRRSAKGYFSTTKDDGYLDTYFCDPPCHTITVQQKYIVDGDSFENTQDVRADRPMTVREVLAKALEQPGPITDSFSLEPADSLATMGAVVKLREQETGCTDGSKTVLSKLGFILHEVFDPTILEEATTEQHEVTYNHRLRNRKVPSTRARASMAM